MPQNVRETLFNAPIRNKSHSNQSNVLIDIGKRNSTRKKKKRKKENILLTAKWNGFLQSKLYEAGNTGRPRNAGSKD